MQIESVLRKKILCRSGGLDFNLGASDSGPSLEWTGGELAGLDSRCRDDRADLRESGSECRRSALWIVSVSILDFVWFQ